VNGVSGGSGRGIESMYKVRVFDIELIRDIHLRSGWRIGSGLEAHSVWIRLEDGNWIVSMQEMGGSIRMSYAFPLCLSICPSNSELSAR